MTVPRGYERQLHPHAVAVARADIAPSLRRALLAPDGGRTTLYAFAAAQPGARRLQGRGTAYAVALPGGPRVVVRHNRHGGMFAPITGDRFLSPTRAPRELEVALALAARGVATPAVLAYAVYPPGGVLQRADVATEEVRDSMDLPAAILERDERAWEATAALVAALARAGARHHDLNAKNVLLAGDRAFVLDVDRVTMGHPAEAALRDNLDRLERSLRKWKARSGLAVDDAAVRGLRDRARALLEIH